MTLAEDQAIKTTRKKVEPSHIPGMGAIPTPEGVSFRVWAPHATAVCVGGEFNKWSKTEHKLAKEKNGYWSVFVPGLKPGATYKFRIKNKSFDEWKMDPYAREVTNSTGECVVYDPTFDWGDLKEYRVPPWNEMVIYEMHVGTFNPAGEGERGTFDSAAEKLDYLSDLGVNTLLIMPPMEFAGDISWGYNPAHPFAVEGAYGGPHALKRFVKAAHEKGIAVLIDVVYNHFGPSDLDLWQFDGWSENDKGGIYFYNDWRSSTPWGDTRPDYGREEVRQYLRDNALMWLEEFQMDGLRFDATAYIRNVQGNENPGDDLEEGWGILRWINDEIEARQPWKITIAEDLRGNALVTAPTSEGGLGFDAQWDAGFVHPVREALIVQEDVHRNTQAVANAVTNCYNGEAFSRVIYTESHDEVANGHARVPEEIWPNNAGNLYAKKRSTLGACITFTSPGIPMVFQGQEMLTAGWFDDNNMLDWTAAEEFKGITQLYRDLKQLRQNAYGHTAGLKGPHVVVHRVDIDKKMLAYHRFDQGGPKDDVIVVVNLSGETLENFGIGFPRGGLWRARFHSDWNGYDPEFSNVHSHDTEASEGEMDGMPFCGHVTVGPYSAIILSQDE